MDLSFHPLTLEAVDAAQAEALCLFVAEDERPLLGLAGLVDWRLAGGLSRLVRSGLVTGSAGESLLMPGRRLGFRKLFLFGLGQGPAAREEHHLLQRLSEAIGKLAAAGVGDAALQLPAPLAGERGVRALLDEPQAPARGLVFGPDPGALVRALSQTAKRAGVSVPPPERRVIKVAGPPRASPHPFAPGDPAKKKT